MAYFLHGLLWWVVFGESGELRRGKCNELLLFEWVFLISRDNRMRQNIVKSYVFHFDLFVEGGNGHKKISVWVSYLFSAKTIAFNIPHQCLWNSLSPLCLSLSVCLFLPLFHSIPYTKYY